MSASRQLPRNNRLPHESGPLTKGVTGLVTLVLLLPIAVVIAMGFNSSSFLDFPPTGFTLRWFSELFEEIVWRRAFRQTVVIAALSAVLAVALATCAAIGVRDSRYRRALEAFFLLPLIVPLIVVALMLFPLYAHAGLLGSTFGLVVAHTVLAFPYAFLVVSGALHGIDRRLEQAAESLGASRMQTLTHVVLPLLAPAIAAATVVAAVVSFDEVIVSLFLSSPSTRTVPVVMWSYVREEIRPTVAAASTLVMVVNVILMTAAARLSTHLVRRRAFAGLGT